jgi:transposase-like protein
VVLRYLLSYRDLEEMMAERGLAVDHVTIAAASPLQEVI